MKSYVNKIASTIDNKYIIHNDMANRGLIGSCLDNCFGFFYHETYYMFYNKEKNVFYYL